MFVVFGSEDVSDEPEECNVNYEKVGCFKDKANARALSVKIFSDRKNIDWEAGKWEKFLKRQVFQCLVMIINITGIKYLFQH